MGFSVEVGEVYGNGVDVFVVRGILPSKFGGNISSFKEDFFHPFLEDNLGTSLFCFGWLASIIEYPGVLFLFYNRWQFLEKE